jgi:hypothetical protein
MLPDVVGAMEEIRRQESHSGNRQPVAPNPRGLMHFYLPRSV